MAKPLRIDVSTTSNDKGLVESAIALNKLADEADKVGNQFKETAVDGGILAAELDRVKRKQLELAAAFDATGEKSLLKQISANKRYETQLKSVGHALEDVGKDLIPSASTAGSSVGKSFFAGVEGTLQNLGKSPEGAAALLGVLTSPGTYGLAAMAGTMIGGAVVAGIGLAGIGAGIGLALQDPAAKAALAGFKTEVGNTLKGAAQPFVEPLETALGRLGANIQTSIGPGLKSMFSELAPEVLTLEKGVEGFLDAAIPGFEKAAVAAKPLLADLGNSELPALGKSIGGLFSTIADHAPEAEEGLKQLFFAVEMGVTFVGKAIDVFSFLFDEASAFMAFALSKTANLVDALDGVAHFLHLPTDGLDKVSAGLDSAAKGANAANDALKGSKSAFDVASGAAGVLGTAADVAAAKTRALNLEWDALDKNLSNEMAIDAAKDAISGLKDQVDKHSRSLDQDTAKGRINREAYAGSIKTLEEQRDQLIKNGMSASDANKLFQGWIKALDKAAEKAGFSSDQIADLNRQLGLIPKSKTVKINVKVNGDGDYITSTGHEYRAEGGDVRAGEPYIVGEKGPELMVPGRSGTIIPNSALRGPGGAGMPIATGGGTQTTVLYFEASGDPLIDTIMQALAGRIRTRFGGNVQIALGGGR